VAACENSRVFAHHTIAAVMHAVPKNTARVATERATGSSASTVLQRVVGESVAAGSTVLCPVATAARRDRAHEGCGFALCQWLFAAMAIINAPGLQAGHAR